MTTYKEYNYPIAMTMQFKHCGNPFRVDTYKGCDFGCVYCFANCRGGKFDKDFRVGNLKIIRNYFKEAFDDCCETSKLTVEMLRHRVPLHLGGLSDPLQNREFDIGLTYEFLKLTKEYDYPVLISTKQSRLADKYWDVLDPKLHAFQISLISLNEDFIRRFETNTPSPSERVAFIKELKSRGFWVGIRLQPLIDINEAVQLVEELSGTVDYITVEHIKIGNDNANKHIMFEKMGLHPRDFYSSGREYEIFTDLKRKNIEVLKSVSKCPIGCGDNDLHELSDSNNCCGIDTINENFSSWIKYNSMYIKKTNDRNQWYPKCNCANFVNGDCRVRGYTFMDYVEDYISKPISGGRCKAYVEDSKFKAVQLSLFD